jgi:site-specific DNA-cytosine methylase
MSHAALTTTARESGLTTPIGVGSVRLLGRVLVACEYSGAVRDAFARLGWDAWSCDILPTDKPGQHFQGDVRDILREGWDIMVAHPPCTHLAVSGARWFPAKRASGEQQAALDFVRLLLDAPIPHIALENPVSIISSKIRKPDQVIQPWQHGHGETKATCLWLKNLPRLTPTNIVEGREQRIWKLPPSADRWKERSRTFPGIAEAMANQWTLATRTNASGSAAGDQKPPK